MLLYHKFWKNSELQQNSNALGCVEKKAAILHTQKPCEVSIWSYNTVILKLLKSNMNLPFARVVHAMFTYLALYSCKPEHAMSEFIKKASKEAYANKMFSVGNTFLTKRKVSTHEVIKSIIFIYVL